MKFRYLQTGVLAAVTAAGIAAAPTAAAENTGQTCINTGAETTQCQSPGNVQITDTPGSMNYDPYGDDGLLLGGFGRGFGHGGGFGGGHGGGHGGR